MIDPDAPVILTTADPDATVMRVRAILAGIDQVEGDAPDGWWPTTTGAAFGAARLAELETLIRDLTLPTVRG